MLRLLGFHGSPVSRVPIGTVLLAFGLWRHAELATVVGVVGAVLVVWGAFTAARGRGQRQEQAR
jgi:hypothetical protein